MESLKRFYALLTAAFHDMNQNIEDWQARNRERSSAKTPNAEPTPWLFLVAVVLVGIIVMFLLGKLVSFGSSPGDYPQRIHAPASGTQILVYIIGYTIIFGPIVALIFLFAAVVCGTAYDADKNRHEREVKAWQADQHAKQQVALRRQAERDAAEASRRAQISRNALVRDEIAKAEQRIRALESEHAAADSKIKEAS